MKDAKIFLTGFMGAGKSTWGKQLAKMLKLPFYDLDAHIEKLHQTSISILFETKGEPYFRTLETKTLIELSALTSGAVIATGGGTPCLAVNRAVMNRSGRVLYLKATEATLFDRLKTEKTKRPLIANKSNSELKNYIVALLQLRESHYLLADEVLEEDELSLEQLKKLFCKA
jgi:shikimate kinase